MPIAFTAKNITNFKTLIPEYSPYNLQNKMAPVESGPCCFYKKVSAFSTNSCSLFNLFPIHFNRSFYSHRNILTHHLKGAFYFGSYFIF